MAGRSQLLVLADRRPYKLGYSSAHPPDLACVAAVGYSVGLWIHGKDKVCSSGSAWFSNLGGVCRAASSRWFPDWELGAGDERADKHDDRN